MNFNRIKVWARALKKNINLLYRVYKHKRTPWYAKVLIAVVLAYAMSPIDLIPDFIPVLGYLDDLILIPAGIALSFKLIPKDVIEECRQTDEDASAVKSRGKYAAAFIVIIWILIILIILRAIIKR